MRWGSIFRRIVYAVAALSIIFEGALIAVPHAHELQSTIEYHCDNPECPNPTGEHLSRELSHHDHSCLACTVGPLTFAASSADASIPLPGMTCERIRISTSVFENQRRWSLPLRGPPETV